MGKWLNRLKRDDQNEREVAQLQMLLRVFNDTFAMLLQLVRVIRADEELLSPSMGQRIDRVLEQVEDLLKSVRDVADEQLEGGADGQA